MPEKSGIEAVPSLNSCPNAADKNRIFAVVVAMISGRVMASPV
jgi:hypothetical protein